MLLHRLKVRLGRKHQFAKNLYSTWHSIQPKQTKLSNEVNYVNKSLRRDVLLPSVNPNRLHEPNSAKRQSIEKISERSYIDMLLVDFTCLDERSRSERNKQLNKVKIQLVNSMNKDDILKTVDTFYCLSYSLADILTPVLHSWTLAWEKLNIETEDIAQILFYIGVTRKAPMEFMYFCEDFIADNVNKFSASELCVICYAFFNCNASMRNYKLIEGIAAKTLNELHSVEFYMLTNVFKAFRHSSYENVEFFQRLGDELLKNKVQDIRHVNSFAQIVFMYASIGIEHLPLLSEVFKNSSIAVESGYRYRTKDLVKLLWAAAIFNHKLESCRHIFGTLCESFIKCMRNEPSLQNRFPKVFVEGLVALAILGYYPKDLISKALSFEELNKDQQYQLQLLDNAVDLFCLDYTGNRLKQTNVLGDLNLNFSKRKGLVHLYQSLVECLGNGFVGCSFLLNWSQIPDIILHFDDHGNAVSLQSDLVPAVPNVRFSEMGPQDSIIRQLMNTNEPIAMNRDIPENMVFHSNSDCFPKRVAIKVYGWNQYALNSSTLLGLHRLEIEMLNKLGYTVITINPCDAGDMTEMTKNQLDNYMDEKVFKVLNIRKP